MCCICFLYMPIIQKEEYAKCAAIDYLGHYTGGGVCIFFICLIYKRRSMQNVLQSTSL